MESAAMWEQILLDTVSGFAEARDRATRPVESVQVTRWRPADAIGFNVANVIPAAIEASETVVFPMSYDYRIEPLVLRRLEILANVVGRRVVAVETPGVTMDASDPESTSLASVGAPTAWASIRGDASRAAATQVQALAEVLGVRISGATRLVGESLAAQAVAAMAAAESPASVDLVEPVNARPRGLRSLAEIGRDLGGLEERRRAAYLRRSADRGWRVPPAFEHSSATNAEVDRRLKRFWNQGRWASLSALSLSRGLAPLLDQTGSAVPIRVWRAADSAVCRRADVEWLVRRMSPREITLLEMRLDSGPAGHHLLSDLDAFVGFALTLRRLWAA